MVNRSITWVVPVAPPDRAQLEVALGVIQVNPGGNHLLPFGSLPMVHFASFTLFDGEPDGQAMLVFESHIDGSIGGYAERLVGVARSGLDSIFKYARGYPMHGPDRAVVEYLARTAKKPQLYHLGHPNLSVQCILGDLGLRRSIENALRTNAALRNDSPVEIVRRVRRMANAPSAFRTMLPWHPAWAENRGEPVPLEQIQWHRDELAFRRFVRFVILIFIACAVEVAFVVLLGYYLAVPKLATMFVASVIIAGIVKMSSPDTQTVRGVLSALLIAGLVEGIVYLLRLEPLSGVTAIERAIAWGAAVPALVAFASNLYITSRLKAIGPLSVSDAQERASLKKLMEAEDGPEHGIYNHVGGLTLLRDDYRFLRRTRTWLALHVLNLFYRTYFVKGKLVSIPSIHFAQWSLIDNRRLLFMTNYDGSADSYLDDFFNSLAKGVAFIWHDTTTFPRTSDPRALKLWVRRNQTLASARYIAPVYDGLTVGIINNNALIRKRLLRGRGARSARRWLRRFSTTPVEPSRLARFGSWLKDVARVEE